jgi:hypothetical protein
VLGQNPSKRHGKSPALKTLYTWFETLELNCVSFDNIYPNYGQFNLKDIQVDYIREISGAYEKIITIGQKAHDVLVLMGISHYALPHPSGLNRQLNNLKFVDQRLKECKNYFMSR